MSAGEPFIVKGVNSGDTLVLLVPNKLPPTEKLVTLSIVEAPRVARKMPTIAPDEPYAWESREFVRKRLIGRTVTFRKDYVVEKLDREFGQPVRPTRIWHCCLFTDCASIQRFRVFRFRLPETSFLSKICREGKKNCEVDASGICVFVSEGLAEVRTRPEPTAPDSQFKSELEAAQNEAKKAKKGKWSTEPESHHVRNITWDPPQDIGNLSANVNGQTHKVLVEQVVNGSLLRVLLLPSYQMVTVSLTGIQCPAMRGGYGANSAAAEPFAVEAKFFTERAILHREVNMLFQGHDARNIANPCLYGSIVQGDKAFQCELLEKGLAKLVTWSISKAGKLTPALKQAELSAKQKQLNIWKGCQVPVAAPEPERPPPYEAQVVQIISGDLITVVRKDNRKTFKVTLSSCRANKRDDDQIMEPGKPGEPPKKRIVPWKNFSWEAREFLRTKLIGQTVRVEEDYSRALGAAPAGAVDEEGAPPPPPQGNAELRVHASIFLKDQNINLALVEAGLARVIGGSPAERSRYFDDLKAAEAKVMEAKLGVHGNSKKSTEVKVVEISKPNPKQCQQYLTTLHVGGNAANPPKQKVIIEACITAARYRVYFVAHGWVLTVALAGVTVPSMGGRPGMDTEPFGVESFEYARDNFVQREGECEVEGFDRSGAFFGTLFIDKANLACLLIKEGLATTNPGVDRNKYAMFLKNAQNEASKAKLRIWSSEDGSSIPKGRMSAKKRMASQAEGGDVIAAPGGGSAPWIPCIVTDIADFTHMSVQFLTEENRQTLREVSRFLSTLGHLQKDTAPLKQGDLVIARYSADNQLYRAKVTRVGGDRITVHYIDFGNNEILGRDRIWVVPQAKQLFDSCPPASAPVGLAFLSPLASEFSNDATLMLRTFVQDYVDDERPLLAHIEYTDALKRKYVVLRGPESGSETAQEQLIREGFSRLQTRFLEGPLAEASQWAETLKHLKRVQEKAKMERINMWQYGEVYSDEDEER